MFKNETHPELVRTDEPIRDLEPENDETESVNGGAVDLFMTFSTVEGGSGGDGSDGGFCDPCGTHG